MKQNHTIAEYLDESNTESREELRRFAVSHLRHTGHLFSESPKLDHNLAAKVRETLFDTEEDIFMQHLRDCVGNPIIRHDYTTEWKLISASAAQQIVATLIAKGILK